MRLLLFSKSISLILHMCNLIDTHSVVKARAEAYKKYLYCITLCMENIWAECWMRKWRHDKTDNKATTIANTKATTTNYLLQLKCVYRNVKATRARFRYFIFFIVLQCDIYEVQDVTITSREWTLWQSPKLAVNITKMPKYITRARDKDKNKRENFSVVPHCVRV